MSDDASSNAPRARGPRRVAKIVAAQLVLLLLLLELVPRLVPVPGLTRDELDPPQVASAAGRRLGPHPYLALSPKPGWESDPQRKKQASHNSLGFRGEEFGWAKPEGTFRIVCMGGSSTYGNGPSSDAQTWPARLGAVLRQRRPNTKFEVINAGAPTWSTFESLVNFAFRVVDLDPDLVVVYHATNDAGHALWPAPTRDNTHYRRVWPIVQPSPIERYLSLSWTYLTWRRYCTDYHARRSDVGHVTIQNYVEGYEDDFGDGPLPDRGFLNFERNLVSLIALAQGHGVPILFMTQALESDDTDHFSHGRNRRRAIDRMTETLQRVTDERGVPLLDMKTHLEGLAAEQVAEQGEQGIFTESVHLTNAGASALAGRLAQGLAEFDLLP